MLKRLLALAGMAVVIGACAQTPAPPPATVDTSADQAALRSDLTKWMDEMNAGNSDAAAAQYAPTAVLMPPNAPSATGTDAIKKALATEAANAKAGGVKLAVKGDPTITVQGDAAWIHGNYVVTDAAGATLDTGKFLSVHHKTNGAWLYLYDIWNSDNPPPPPPPSPKK